MIPEAKTWVRPGLKLPSMGRNRGGKSDMERFAKSAVTYQTKIFKWKSTGPRKYKWRLLCPSGSCPAEGYAPNQDKARKAAQIEREAIVNRSRKNNFPAVSDTGVRDTRQPE